MAPEPLQATEDARREEFHEILVGILGSRNVYFQPPSNLQMQYPCIRYSRGRASSQFADNRAYRLTKQYEVTLIQEDPDSSVWDKIANLPMTTHERWYPADNLNHDVFNTYF